MADENQTQQPMMSMERVYIKDVSYESPNSPHVFLEQSSPKMNVQLNVSHRKVSDEKGYFEVVLIVTVNAQADEKTIFLVEVQQAGVFLLTGISDEDLPKLLEIACPNVLLPFAREAINDFVSKGGFPQLLINPVNFEALYAQKQAAEAQKVQH